MWTDTFTFWQLAAPTFVVLGVLYIAGPLLPMARPWARAVVVAFVGFILLRYLGWRVVDTVWPATGTWYEVGWIWLCLAIELFALIDAAILLLTFLRRGDRSADADRHEKRLRALPARRLPRVDVLIPTYNEPIEVLEKTIIGALCIDYPDAKVWVCDDGRRRWLREYCKAKGVGYLTRPDNAHGKAGNINHALKLTDGEFIAVFDADFVPQANFLMRTLGFFEDLRVGVVQTPHAFYNYDPMQANLALRKTLPHDQCFFFESIMPSRDGWDAAFCCGSNSVTRRAAIDAAGGALPTESITEDILLTMTLLRHGYVTRYLNERLAYGLAPESLEAFFIQRERWARGGIQTMFLAAGPFGRGLRFVHRLMFFPAHWLTQSFALMLALIAPLVFLWLGLLPFVNVTPEAQAFYTLPTILAVLGGIWLFAPVHFSPLVAYVLNTFQSFRLLPHVVQTLLQPFGHIFKVTPKGRDAGSRVYQSGIFWVAAALMGLTIGGLAINTLPEYQIVKSAGVLATVAILGLINVLVLFLVCMLSLQAPLRRAETRFDLTEPVSLTAAAGKVIEARFKDLSMSGAAVVLGDDHSTLLPGDRVTLSIAEVGRIAGRVARRQGALIGVRFDLPPSIERDLLIRKLFTAGRDATAVDGTVLSTTAGLLKIIWSHRPAGPSPVQDEEPLPPPADTVRLPARSFMIEPHVAAVGLAELGAQRRSRAA